MKLREFVNLYAGDEVLMNLYSEDGTEFDTVSIDPSLASTNRIDKKWLDGEVEYFDFHDDELHVSVSIPTVTAATSRKRSFTVTASRSSSNGVTTVDDFNRKYGDTEYGCWDLRAVDDESYEDEIQYVLYEYDPEFDKTHSEAAFESIDRAVRYVEYMIEHRKTDPIWN